MFNFKQITMILLLLSFCLNISGLYAQQPEPEIEIATGEIPPFSYMKEGQVSGVVTDVVREIMRRVNHSGNILVEPWKRVIVKSADHRLSYPISRTPEREKNYKWIGPVLSHRYTFTVPASDTKNYSRIEDFKEMRIGVSRGAPSETRLEKLGFMQIDAVSLEELNLKKLTAGRIDAWFASDLITKGVVKQSGIDESLIKNAFSDETIEVCIVASPDIEDNVVDLWQKKLDEMKSDGSYLEIMKKYGIEAR